MRLGHRERHSKDLTWNIPTFLWDRKCQLQGEPVKVEYSHFFMGYRENWDLWIPNSSSPEFPPVLGPGAPELLGSFFPAGIPRALDLHLLFAPIPLGNFHPFPFPVFLGILFIWNVPMEQLLWDFGSSLFGIGLGR